MQVAPKASTGHGGSGDGEGRHKQKQQAFHRTRVGHDCDGIKVTRVSSEHGKADGVDAIKFWDQAIERLKQGEKWIIVNEECRKLKMSARHKHVLRTERFGRHPARVTGCTQQDSQHSIPFSEYLKDKDREKAQSIPSSEYLKGKDRNVVHTPLTHKKTETPEDKKQMTPCTSSKATGPSCKRRKRPESSSSQFGKSQFGKSQLGKKPRVGDKEEIELSKTELILWDSLYSRGKFEELIERMKQTKLKHMFELDRPEREKRNQT